MPNDSAAHFQSAKTHCPSGHPYDSENTLEIGKDGRRHRKCRTCQQAAVRRATTKFRSSERPPCSFDGCGRPIFNKMRRLCQTHYKQAMAGTPLRPIHVVEIDDEGRKRCRTCRTWKEPTEFYKAHRASDGRASHCRDCEQQKRRASAEQSRDRRRESRFGLTREAFEVLLNSQGGRCAICETDKPGARFWHIDHDHQCCPGRNTCGQCVRGILCSKCNAGIGFFSDDAAKVRRALTYLER